MIQKELETNFPLKIPLNAYIDKNTWHLVIKVNNEVDHLKVQQLGEIKKAFDKGLKLLMKKKTFHLAIHHVDENVDLNKSTFAKIREENAITEVKRLRSKEGVNLRTLKIVIDDQSKFDKLIRDRQIQKMGMIAKPVSKWVFKDRPNQQ